MDKEKLNTVISRKKIRALIGISRTTEFRWITKGLLPRIVKVDGRIIGYCEKSYNIWLDDHTE